MLVPLVDFVNTGYPDEINLVCRTESESLYVDCVTDRDIQPGTEVQALASMRPPLAVQLPDAPSPSRPLASARTARRVPGSPSSCGRTTTNSAPPTCACCSTLASRSNRWAAFGGRVVPARGRDSLLGGQEAATWSRWRAARQQNLEDTLIFALPELTISNEALKMKLLAELSPEVQRSVKSETNQCGVRPGHASWPGRDY